MVDEQIAPTLTLEAAASVSWEVLVIGAGPAGAIAARELARNGVRVLLVDRATFPRHKVCGCCLNGAALAVLSEVGLGDLPQQCGAAKLHEFHVASGRRFATVPLPQGVSLSRERLDAELIKTAIDSGAELLDDTQALIHEDEGKLPRVQLKMAARQQSVFAKVIVPAGGLGCRVFANEQHDERQVSDASRVGAGAVLDESSADFADGTIYMACHRDGYVGLVRLEDGRLDIAAALDPAAIKRLGGIATLVAEILAASEMAVPASLSKAKWQGTGKLTQQREHVAGRGYFVVGDAAGYVEPFTGEGIAWALATGSAVVPFVLESLSENMSTGMLGWSAKRRELIGRRMRLCRTVSLVLRYPALVGIAVRLLARAPGLARPVVKSLNASFRAASAEY
jgi:flavin-dependent dehydrogenase